jgi:acyl-CoA reductase-like NAD-dependent aldehyde dehydrogenase
MGDPLNEENDLGPMARFDLRDELHQQVEACRRGGYSAGKKLRVMAITMP